MRAERQIPYLVFMLALSIFAVAALAVASFAELSPDTRTVLEYADTAVCGLFLLDFIITLVRSEHRARYLLRWGWLDLLSSIPTIDALRWGRLARVLRIIRVVRGMKATKVLAEFVLERRAQSAFLAAALLSILLVVFSSAAILQFESSPEANIRTPEDAIWWSVVTITTVGYGDRYPLSSEGRLVAALLMTAGVGLFGTFSGFVAAWFLSGSSKQGDERSEIEQQLVREIRELRELIERDRTSRF